MSDAKNENEVVYLRLDDILPNQFQPREVFDEAGLEELAESIKEHGVIQPVIVRPQGDKYELIAGERRCKASALAGLTKVPAIIREMDDRESAKVSLLENLQRKNLSAIEEARTYKKILELEDMTQEELARTMGRSQPLIANKIRLLNLPEEIQDALIKNQISERHARSLLNVKDKEQQLKLLDKIRDERLTVRELDTEIKKIVQPVNPLEMDNEPQNDNEKEIEKEPERGEEEMPHNEMNSGIENNKNSDIPNNAIDNMDMLNNNSNNQGSFMNNPFGNTPNYNSNFGGMGLNDYQSSINGGMFNNIPNFGAPINQQNTSSSNVFLSSINDSLDSKPEDNAFVQSNQSNFQTPNNLDNPNQDLPNNNYSSLGSMFDGASNNSQNQNQAPDYSSSNNSTFVSQIRENTIKPKENQFLPNFDTPNDFDNNQNSFSEPQNDFGMNNFINQSQNSGFNNFNSNQNGGINDFNNQSLNNMNNSFNEPINDFSFPSNNHASTPSNNFLTNQGSLFNQPLNIVSVPTQNIDNNVSENTSTNEESNNFEVNNNISMNNDESNDNMNFNYNKEIDLESSNSEENGLEKDIETNEEEPNDDSNEEKEAFDNPLDDAYEDILNAKPVSINPDTETNDIDANIENNNEEPIVAEDDDDDEAPDDIDTEEVELIGSDSNKPLPIEDENNNQSNENIEPKTPDNEPKNDYIVLEPPKTIFDAYGAVYELKKTTDAIKQNNINIDTEEIEFDDYYQIIIKIKK